MEPAPPALNVVGAHEGHGAEDGQLEDAAEVGVRARHLQHGGAREAVEPAGGPGHRSKHLVEAQETRSAQ
jgi:hypothetical protein